MKTRQLLPCAVFVLVACEADRGEYPPAALAAVAIRVQEIVHAGTLFGQSEPRELLVAEQIGYPESTMMDATTIRLFENAGLKTAAVGTRSDSAAVLSFLRVTPDSVRNRWRIAGSVFFYVEVGSYSDELTWIVECRRSVCRVIEEIHEIHSDYG